MKKGPDFCSQAPLVGIPPSSAYEKTALCLIRAVISVGWQSIFGCFIVYPFVHRRKPIGRDIYNKPYQSVQRDFDPEVYELAPATKLGAFPGYSKVLLSHKDLQTIIKLDAPEWKNALSSVKGVYCITDRSTGQLYIGSATGDIAGIWQRWSSYADVTNLTGGNKAFEELKNNGADYIVENFSYSILEIFDMRTKREDIIQRESYWKRVFQTIKYGMNNN